MPGLRGVFVSSTSIRILYHIGFPVIIHKSMSSFKWQRFIVICFLAIGLGAFGGFVYWVISDFPEVRSLESYTPLESSFIYSSDGHQLAEFYLERRNFVPHYKIPAMVKNAFIAIE